jgi:mannose-6-phosphate isomerase-like protein (cupin superfamily)
MRVFYPLHAAGPPAPRAEGGVVRRVVGALVGIACVLAVRATGQEGVRYFPAAEVDASFAKGGTLIQTAAFRIMTAQRTAGGEAELHALDRDIFHVLEGGATFVTGGTLVGAHETAPGETRATAIDGGATQELRAGDVITIPKGVPHWFKAVDGKVRYFVVKVRD